MSFNPAYPYNLPKLPQNIDLQDSKLLNLVIKARSELAELKGYTYSMPNPFSLLSPAIIKESLASSEIENINTTMIDVLENQLFPEAEQKQPDKEVLWYRDAILWGYENLDNFSISTRLILGIAEKLLPTSYNGYRTDQNIIENSNTHEAVYTPPVASEINDLMGNLEIFINSNSEQIDPLIRCIISHHQFEAIHPFGDGNGRTGRILMILELVNYKILNFPTLYISRYINKNRSEYYNHLLNISKENNWNDFICFMLEGFYLQAKETKNFFFSIMKLYHDYKDVAKKDHKTIYSADLVELLFSFPIITAAKLSSELGIHRETSGKYLAEFAKAGLLTNRRVGKYNFYINNQLLSILHGPINSV